MKTTPNTNYGKGCPRLLALARFYFTMTLLFLLAKPCFILAQSSEKRAGFEWAELPKVLWHGLQLDLSTAGELSALVWLLLGVSIWTRVPHITTVYRIYAGIASAMLSLVFVGDACLYNFWGIKLDGTIWNYLSRPQGALASVSAGYAAAALLALLAVGLIFYLSLRNALPAPPMYPRTHRWPRTAGWVLLGGLIFLSIRGGVGKGVANVGMVYYSTRPFTNHAAVNPAFSLISSTVSTWKTRDYAEEFNYFKESERKSVFAALGYPTASTDPEPLLNNPRPNVLLIIMEGCGGTFVNAVDSLADPKITPNLNHLAREGVLFSRCYANSFRTDRGVVSVLSGYPAFPDLSVMKKNTLCAELPSIARTLSKAGWNTEFLYGGDINFTNTNGYIFSTGYRRAYSDKDFPAGQRRTHDWGVTDRLTFARLYEMVTAYPQNRPWHLGFLTLASHDPWGVPYNRIKGDKIANAMAYLDDCVGNFIARFRQTPQWKNTLVILLPDHGIEYPAGLPYSDARRAHIPMIWTGGVVKGAKVVDKLLNQSDLAATLLGQLRLPHDDFRFSRDVLSRSYTRPSAVNTWPGGILWKDTTGETAIDLTARPERVLRETPAPSAERQRAARAWLQTIYDELGKLQRK